ncbi:MAG: arginine deiminase [Bacilli bacterium]|jgi:arginine deiminase|nr:arginine deiminase [Bacilli bacterium]
MNYINIQSEIGRLRRVVIHRPGHELKNLTPKFLSELLFDDIPFLVDAQKEHDEFASLLKKEKVEVIYLEDLFQEAIKDEKVRLTFLYSYFKENDIVDSHDQEKLIKYFQQLSLPALVEKIFSGVTEEEFPSFNEGRLRSFIDDYPFIIDPMPNLYFTRDPAFILGNHLSISRMASSARRRETLIMETILKNNSNLVGNIPLYSRNNISSLEGGDILALGKDKILIGLSERSEPAGIEKLAENAFKNSDIREIYALNLPKKRSFMHLDTVLTQVDGDKFVAHHQFISHSECFRIFPKRKSVGISVENGSLGKVLSKIIKKPALVIPCGGNSRIASDREQWNDGANTLALAPGKVIAYKRNYETNRMLELNGVKVIPTTSSELARGRGGPRCMSMPLYRDEI